MARGTEVITVVRTDNIVGMMNPTGQVGRWMGRRAQAVTIASRAEVKNRTGHLASTIHSTGVHHDLPFSAHFDTRATADYALYVHEGTMMVAPIRSNRSFDNRGRRYGKMHVPVRKHSAIRGWRVEVRGQRANDFLVKGMNHAFKGEIGSTVAFLPR